MQAAQPPSRHMNLLDRLATHLAARLANCLAALALGAVSLGAHAEPLTVVYPGTFSPDEHRASYYVALLDLVMSKSGTAYKLQTGAVKSGNFIAQLAEVNGDIDVNWGITSRSYEDNLLPVRIPIDKGILGWRLFLIRAGDQRKFDKIHSLQQLKSVVAGQQRYWSDVDVLRANGLSVVEGSDYYNLFNMLAGERFEYFPRGVGEIWGEADNSAKLGLVVEQHLALHYPVNAYFFVSRRNFKLAKLIEQGLRTAIKDGSFDKLFDQYNGAAIKRAGLKDRTVFELKNPLQPEIKPLLPGGGITR